uniref:Uncharacterized protein n=1 Tax=Cacopsylla melanoneura TaxID=428564 RepID=A0A8D8TFY5_9HEMI
MEKCGKFREGKEGKRRRQSCGKLLRFCDSKLVRHQFSSKFATTKKSSFGTRLFLNCCCLLSGQGTFWGINANFNFYTRLMAMKGWSLVMMMFWSLVMMMSESAKLQIIF